MTRGQGHAFLQSLLTTRFLKLINGFHVEFACGIALTCGEDSYLKTDVLSYLASTVARKLFV